MFTSDEEGCSITPWPYGTNRLAMDTIAQHAHGMIHLHAGNLMYKSSLAGLAEFLFVWEMLETTASSAKGDWLCGWPHARRQASRLRNNQSVRYRPYDYGNPLSFRPSASAFCNPVGIRMAPCTAARCLPMEKVTCS